MRILSAAGNEMQDTFGYASFTLPYNDTWDKNEMRVIAFNTQQHKLATSQACVGGAILLNVRLLLLLLFNY
jgi:hypothetical protein